ncbi:traB domain-containing protein isoform X2 [Orussus abietinus]|uniref:traB domain-containing protein isoform X2 n=1 Tax=Orussus abietinus TaxID=222816 RepID=UPI00062572AC|nr:traB domain-containing protein isoform X2 [Orussus abietinus]
MVYWTTFGPQTLKHLFIRHISSNATQFPTVLLWCRMSTTSNAFKEHAIGDVKEDLPLTENEDFSIVNEKGDNVIDPRISLRSPLDELISRESGKLGPSDFNDTVQSSASTTIIQMEREDSERSDSNKQRHTESMENDISFLPSSEQSIGSGLESDIEDNDSDSDMTQTPTLKYDPNIDNNLPETVALLTAQDGGKVYLIGTAHFSIESNKDVAKVIQMVQPHMVMVELCSARIHILQLDENTIMEQAKNISFQSIYNVIKQNGAFNGLMYILLLNMSARLTKELGMAPGGEFRTAFVEAKKVPKCMVHLGDRPINITIQRALNSLTWWQTLKMGWHLLVPSKAVTLEEVERLKRRDFLEEVLAEMAGEFPALRDVFINERDIFLTYSLQLAALSQRTPHGTTPCRVVAVVGIGHMAGIIENWRKVKHSQIPPILRIPPLSLSTKILRFTVKASLLGTVLYVVYKIIPLPSGATLQSIKSSVEGLLKDF